MIPLAGAAIGANALARSHPDHAAVVILAVSVIILVPCVIALAVMVIREMF